MEITFDTVKRNRTLEERHLDFADCGVVFSGKHLTREDTRKEYNELRFQTVGYLNDRMIVIAWTPRGVGRRIISMRKANDREQEIFKEALG
jgi:uncharacterized DUF497 family protein